MVRLNHPMIRLNLTIKKEWFDLIRIGAKREEYRTIGNRQVERLFGATKRGNFPANSIAIFRNGYNIGSAAVAVEITGLAIRNGDKAQHPEWGEPGGEHFVINLGKVLCIAPYHDVREMFKKGE